MPEEDPVVVQAHETKYSNLSLTPLPAPLFTGLKLLADIQLGSLVLNTLDESDNVIWICTDISGWWGPPDVDFDTLQKSGTDGVYDVDGRYQSRQLELSGSILPPGPTFVAAARETLIQAISLVRTGAWLKTIADGTTIASYVRLSGRPTVETVNARGRIDFNIPLRAADPVKYEWNSDAEDGFFSASVQAENSGEPLSGSVVVTNDGNHPVGAIFSVTGPLEGVSTIYNATTDKILRIVGEVEASTVLEINTFDRSVSYDGEYLGARAKLDPLVDWFTLQPGLNTIEFVDEGTATATAQLVIKYRSGWIG